MIDTHVHIAWHFGPDGRYQPRDDSPVNSLGYTLENAYVTLMAGFITVQSLGSQIDGDARNAITRGVLPGPRILTALHSGMSRSTRTISSRRSSISPSMRETQCQGAAN
jgi:imidazolonepropionase-like amidohydrolase